MNWPRKRATAKFPWKNCKAVPSPFPIRAASAAAISLPSSTSRRSAILGLGRGALQPVVRDGKIEPRLMLPLTLSYDHRVIDGGMAVRFILEIVQGFEAFNGKGLE